LEGISRAIPDSGLLTPWNCGGTDGLTFLTDAASEDAVYNPTATAGQGSSERSIIWDAGTPLGALASRRRAAAPGNEIRDRAGETPALPAKRSYFVLC